MSKFKPVDHDCKWENRNLMESGKTCNICMGMVRNPGKVLDELMPERIFDDSYFQELEAYYYGDADMDILA